ncbi:MAG: hypothetical protein JJU00_11750 [Opitutales bacterium]|nr:hypothetical protein [Opitutales bacterium]
MTTSKPAFIAAEPRLWITPEALERRRGDFRAGPLAAAMDSWIAEGDRLLSSSTPEADTPLHERKRECERAVDIWTSLYLATGEARYAEAAANAALENRAMGIDSCLGRAAIARRCATVLDFCAGAVDPAIAAELASVTGDLARDFVNITDGNPDNPFNNWWGVTHSAEGLAALAAMPYDPSLEAVFEAAAEKVRFYISHYGEHGHCYEGTGYGQYAFSHWAPFVLAVRHATGRDLTVGYDGVARMGALIAAMTVALPHSPEASGMEPPRRLGRRIHWNDDGGNGGFTGTGMLHFALSDRRYLGSLRSFCDALHGSEGDNGYALPVAELLWTFLYYPLDTKTEAPGDFLPLSPVDFRTGLAVFRNGYNGADDCVFGAYAKNWHGGGHVHDDAGSFRFIGLGGEWAQNGGQAKFGPENQCAILVDGGQQPEGWPIVPGKILYHAANPGGGGAVSLRLDKTYNVSRVDRHFTVDYSGALNCEAILAVHDRLWDRRERLWTWTLCLGPDTNFEVVPGGNGFTLRAGGAAALHASFMQPQPVEIELREGPPSERTFSNGAHRVYPGVRHVRASVRAQRTDFFVVLSLCRGTAPQWNREDRNGIAAAVCGGTEIALQMSRWHEGPLRIQNMNA